MLHISVEWRSKGALLSNDSKERGPTSKTIGYTFVAATSGTTQLPSSYVRIGDGRQTVCHVRYYGQSVIKINCPTLPANKKYIYTIYQWS